MTEISRAALFGKLTSISYKTIESATVFCKLRGNPYVELAHWMHQILATPDSDVVCIATRFGLDEARLGRDLIEALDRLPRGATSITDLSSHVEDAVERGFVYASLLFGESQVSTGHLLVGLLKTPSLRNVLFGLSREFSKVHVDELCAEFATIVQRSKEHGPGAAMPTTAGAPGEASAAMAPAAMGKGEALQRFSIDLTAQAREGELDPVTGRDAEIRQIIDILMRRRQNNPILTGEAGVGKTAVVEGFAHRIAKGDVPPQLRDVELRTLDVGLLQAGASMKGEFEQRLRQVIEEVQTSPKPIVLFIDEAHTLIGAGGAAGTGDAANLLKPALARGNLRVIAATTWSEYKKHIEKDPALTRRFQVIQVHEPAEAQAIGMLRGMAQSLEQHHRVLILDEAINAAVRLSHRYIPARQLPDKAVSLLDTACARVAISQHAVPPALEDCQRRIEALRIELEIIGREASIGIDVAERKAKAERLVAEQESRRERLEGRWKAEKAMVERVLALRSELAPEVHAEAAETGSESKGTATLSEEERAARLAELSGLEAELALREGDAPLVSACVDEQSVAVVVGSWTGIPVGRMVKNELETVLKLPDLLEARVIGQRHALEMIARRIQSSRAGLENPQKPVGVFLLAGPSGVGKTETALALAEALYGGEQNLITINMSEFQEAHTVSTLKGAPPGYVGYGEGGVLTEAVRRRPYSVVLLDEVEKAHSDVHEIFFQVFDKGMMEDGEGRHIDFKNTLILLTSNVGTELTMRLCNGGQERPPSERIAQALRGPLLEAFPPALLGRLVVVPYYPLSETLLESIVRMQLERVERRLMERHGVSLEIDDDVIKLITSRCTELDSGARMIDNVLSNSLLPGLSRELLTRTLAGEQVKTARVSIEQGELSYTVR